MEHEGSARKSLPSGMGRSGGITGEQEFLEAGFSHQRENLCKNQASFSQGMVLKYEVPGVVRVLRHLRASDRGPGNEKTARRRFSVSC
ncbi:hypothetical protein RBH89_05980 [Paracidovorax avenae]